MRSRAALATLAVTILIPTAAASPLEHSAKMAGKALSAAGGAGATSHVPCPTSGDAHDCDHPFAARCEAIRADSSHQNFQANALETVESAVVDAAKETSSGSLAELAISRLRAKGIDVPPMSGADQQKLQQELLMQWFDLGAMESGSPAATDAMRMLTPTIFSSCSQPAPWITEMDSKKRARLLRQQLSDSRAMITRLEAASDHVQSSREPASIYGDLVQNCRMLRSGGATPMLPGMPSPSGWKKACSPAKISQLRSQVIEDYGDEGSGKKPDAELTRSLIDALRATSAVPPSAPIDSVTPDKLVEPELDNAVINASSRVSALCAEGNYAVNSLAQSELTKLRTDLARSKPVVRALEAKFLTPSNYDAAQKVVDDAKADVKHLFLTEIAPNAGLTPEKTQAIARQLDQIPLYRQKPAADSDFETKPNFGLAVLRDSAPPPQEAVSRPSPFADAALTSFTQTNAMYSPFVQQGAVSAPEMISVEPVLLLQASSDPDTLRGVVSHEIGHKLGPEVSALNGTDLRPSYSKLLGCFQHELNLQPNQGDEAFADWVSSRVCGARLEAIADPAARSVMIDEIIRPICLFQEDAINLDDPHPDEELRIERIFGHDPQIRQALGCPVGPHCTLKGEAP